MLHNRNNVKSIYKDKSVRVNQRKFRLPVNYIVTAGRLIIEISIVLLLTEGKQNPTKIQ
jgi:hypothetical protein